MRNAFKSEKISSPEQHREREREEEIKRAVFHAWSLHNRNITSDSVNNTAHILNQSTLLGLARRDRDRHLYLWQAAWETLLLPAWFNPTHYTSFNILCCCLNSSGNKMAIIQKSGRSFTRVMRRNVVHLLTLVICSRGDAGRSDVAVCRKVEEITKGVHCSKIKNSPQNYSGGHNAGWELGGLDVFENPAVLAGDTPSEFTSGSQEMMKYLETCWILLGGTKKNKLLIAFEKAIT